MSPYLSALVASSPFAGGKPNGFKTIRYQVWQEVDDDRGYFGMLAVDPSRQGRGLGRALVQAAESFCAAAGCTDLDIDVVDLRTELPPFYHALGFTPVGATPYGDPERTRQPMQLVHMTKSLVSVRRAEGHDRIHP